MVAKHWRWIVPLALLLLVLTWLMVGRGPRVKQGTVLVMDLEGSYAETHATPYLARLLGTREQCTDPVDELHGSPVCRRQPTAPRGRP